MTTDAMVKHISRHSVERAAVAKAIGEVSTALAQIITQNIKVYPGDDVATEDVLKLRLVLNTLHLQFIALVEKEKATDKEPPPIAVEHLKTINGLIDDLKGPPEYKCDKCGELGYTFYSSGDAHFVECVRCRLRTLYKDLKGGE